MIARLPQCIRTGGALLLALLVSFLTVQGAHVATPAGLNPARAQIDPGLSAQSAIAVNLSTGVLLYEHNADLAVPPASTAKLITSLAARAVLELSEPVTIEEGDLVPEEFSRMGVEPGDVVTVEELLYGTLMPSGGDAARALARAAGRRLDESADDQVARFVDEMNVVAASLGMTSSSFGNPVGMDDEQSRTTARDLVRATEAIFADPLLRRIVGTQWANISVEGPNARELVIENSNQFVLFDGAIGVKTGTTDAAGQNLVNAFLYGDHVILTVVLGSQDRYLDTTLMLEGVAGSWQWRALGRDAASAGATEELAQMGLWMPVGLTLMLHAEQLDRIEYEILLAEESSGPARGIVRFSLDGQVIAELPVYDNGTPATN
jgi:D-alanyl-D-alanine carboxypeptidase (penicillin-binding protein 5/6)